MDQRISLITLGVNDLHASRTFYEALGWRGESPSEDIVFFQAGGMIVSLWDRSALALDSGVEDRGGWSGITLAHNVNSPADVDRVIDEARSAGGPPSRSSRQPRSGVATRAAFVTSTDTRGKWPTTPDGRSMTTVRSICISVGEPRASSK